MGVDLATQQLIAHFGIEHTVLFGRARSGLLALFEVLGLHGRSTIIIPSNACPSLFASAWASGARVRLAPVCAQTGITRDEELAQFIETLSENGQSGAVLFTHLYGYRIAFTQSRKIAHAQNWITIENDANASSFADQSDLLDLARVVSFGGSKTIDAGGGGAVLTHDPRLADTLLQRAKAYPVLDDQAEKQDAQLTMKRRAYRNSGQAQHGEALLIEEISQLRFGFADKSGEALSNALNLASKKLSERQKTKAVWAQALEQFSPIITLNALPQPSPWRLIAHVDAQYRDLIVTALRKAELDAGTNYPALFETFASLAEADKHPASQAWAKSALNLWLDERYTQERITKASQVIDTLLERSG